jgi:hypothetical protein
MLVSQCPCADPDAEVTVNVINPDYGSCPANCEIAASATITIEEAAAITASTCSRRVTDSGVIPTGVRSVSFLNDGAGNATVNGQTLLAGTSLMFPVLGGNTVYGAITYDATGTTLRIDWTAWGAGAPICE